MRETEPGSAVQEGGGARVSSSGDGSKGQKYRRVTVAGPEVEVSAGLAGTRNKN